MSVHFTRAWGATSDVDAETSNDQGTTFADDANLFYDVEDFDDEEFVDAEEELGPDRSTGRPPTRSKLTIDVNVHERLSNQSLGRYGSGLDIDYETAAVYEQRFLRIFWLILIGLVDCVDSPWAWTGVHGCTRALGFFLFRADATWLFSKLVDAIPRQFRVILGKPGFKSDYLLLMPLRTTANLFLHGIYFDAVLSFLGAAHYAGSATGLNGIIERWLDCQHPGRPDHGGTHESWICRWCNYEHLSPRHVSTRHSTDLCFAS